MTVAEMIKENQNLLEVAEDRMNYAEGLWLDLNCLTLTYLQKKIDLLYKIAREEGSNVDN